MPEFRNLATCLPKIEQGSPTLAPKVLGMGEMEREKTGVESCPKSFHHSFSPSPKDKSWVLRIRYSRGILRIRYVGGVGPSA